MTTSESAVAKPMQTKSSYTINFIIKMVVYFVLIAAIWNITPSGALTEAGVHTIAVFAGIIYGLIFIRQYGIPCLLTIFLMGFTGAYASMNDSFIAAFGNPIFVMIFTVLLLSGIIAYTGLAKNIALKMVNAKFAAGRPWILTTVILVTSTILSTFIHPLVIIVIMADLIVEIYQNVGIKGNRWTMFVLMDMAVMAICAQNIMPFQAGQVLMFGLLSGYDERLALSNYAGTFILVQIIIQVLLLAFCLILTRIFCSKDVEELRNYKPTEEKYPFTSDMKVALVIMIGFVFLQLFPLVLPQGIAIRAILEKPSLAGYCILACIIGMLIIKKRDGEHFITFEQITGHGINWYMLMMLAALGACTGPMTAEVTGIIQWLSDMLTPICTSMTLYGAFAVLIIINIVFTNLTDNVAVMFVTIPVMYVVCLATGLNPVSVLTIIVSAVELGILLPSATPHIALIFAKEGTGYLKRGPMIGWMVPRIAFATLIYLTFGWAVQGWFPVLI